MDPVDGIKGIRNHLYCSHRGCIYLNKTLFTFIQFCDLIYGNCFFLISNVHTHMYVDVQSSVINNHYNNH